MDTDEEGRWEKQKSRKPSRASATNDDNSKYPLNESLGGLGPEQTDHERATCAAEIIRATDLAGLERKLADAISNRLRHEKTVQCTSLRDPEKGSRHKKELAEAVAAEIEARRVVKEAKERLRVLELMQSSGGRYRVVVVDQGRVNIVFAREGLAGGRERLWILTRNEWERRIHKKERQEEAERRLYAFPGAFEAVEKLK